MQSNLIFRAFFVANILFFFFINAVKADELFSYGFEKGNLKHSENGVSFRTPKHASVSSNVAKGGAYSLKFFFEKDAPGDYSHAEARIRFPKTSEIWISYDLYVPVNYSHRSNPNGPNNNKFLAVFRSPYSPTFQVNWSLDKTSSNNSNLKLHRFRNGKEQKIISPSAGKNILTKAEGGTWHNFQARVKVPSSRNSNDGVMQMWKDGKIVSNETKLDNYGGDGKNYIDELYLLGWSNSGYNQDTYFYIDNIKISGTKQKSAVKPKPPKIY